MYESESEKKRKLNFYQHDEKSPTAVVDRINLPASIEDRYQRIAELAQQSEAPQISLSFREDPATTQTNHNLSAFDKILYQMKEKHLVKNHDYAHGKRKYENYLSTGEDMGIDPWKIAFMRLVEKTKRVQSFARTGITKVKDESIEDTLLDIAILGVITLDMIQASRADTEQE